MKCKKCRKDIPEKSKFCNHCGAPIEDNEMYRRPDGLYEKSVTINGKRHVFRGKSKKIVFAKMTAFKEEASKGPLFTVVANNWHDEHWETLSFTTQKGYKPAFDEITEYFKSDYINQINHSKINKYIKSLPKSFARKTCCTRLLVLNSIFKYAINNDLITDNPCAYVSIPKGHSSTKRRAPTETEIKTIKANVDCTYKNIPVGLFAVFLMYTGCRKGEALAIQFKDIDYDNARITINKSVYYESTKPKLKLPKTEAGIRTIIIPSILLKLLPKGNPENYLFSDNPEKPMSGSIYDYAWEYYQKETGLNLTAHNLRHGYASILLEADISVKDAQDLLGHADASTTQNIYQEVSKKRKKQTEIKLNNYLQ